MLDVPGDLAAGAGEGPASRWVRFAKTVDRALIGAVAVAAVLERFRSGA